MPPLPRPFIREEQNLSGSDCNRFHLLRPRAFAEALLMITMCWRYHGGATAFCEPVWVCIIRPNQLSG
jgi:hypothetical protein